MFQKPPDHRRVLHAGNDSYRPPALLAGFDVDKVNWCEASREGALGYVEYPLKALGPGHGGVALGCCLSSWSVAAYSPSSTTAYFGD